MTVLDAIRPLRAAAPRDSGREDQVSAIMMQVARDIDAGAYGLDDPSGQCLVGWARARGVDLTTSLN